MAQKWTSTRNELLFLLLVDQVKVDGKALADAWKAKYTDTGVDDYLPTERAIKEHIGALKKSAGGGKASNNRSSATPRPKATPKATPRKPAAPKTPKSSAKRKRTQDSDDDKEDIMMDGEDDTDAERKMLNSSPIAPRSTLSRRSKNVAKSYANDDSGEEEDAHGEGDDAAHATTPAAGNAPVGTFFDGAAETTLLDERVGQMGFTTNGDLTPQSNATNGTASKSATKRIKREIGENESDESDFSPDL